MADGKPYRDFTGYRAGTWTVISEAGFRGGRTMKWLARCVCGKEKIQTSNAIPRWKGRCLCTGGRPKYGHPLYGTWANMKHRCMSPKSKNYPLYGGRGITVCERWLGKDGLQNFIADVGERPPGTTLDRINPNGNYEPTNVRWATAKEQMNNQRLSDRRVRELLSMLEGIVDETPNITATVLLQVIRKQLLGSV